MTRRPALLGLLGVLLCLPACQQRVCRKLPKLPDLSGTCGDLSQLRPVVAWRPQVSLEACQQAVETNCSDEDLKRLWGFADCYARLAPCRVEDVEGFLNARSTCAHPALSVSASCAAAWPGPPLSVR